MKIRQKIAMLLAAAMTLTAVPMVTMAKSDNSLTRSIVVGEEDKALEESGVVGAKLKIELKDAATTDDVFYLVLENAEWNNDDASNDGEPIVTTTNAAGTEDAISKVTATADIDSEAKIKFNAPMAAKSFIYVDFSNVTLTGGDATYAIKDSDSPVSEASPIIFARTTDGKANVTVGDATSIYQEGKVATITVLEGVKGQLTNPSDTGHRTIKLTINHPDYKFVNKDESMVPSRGFVGLGTSGLDIDPDSDDDEQYAEIVLDSRAAADFDSTGRLEIKNLYLKATTKDPSTGDLTITVEGDKVNSTDVKVANVAKYGTKVSVKDDKVVNITAGTKEKVTVILEETAQDSFIEGKTVTVEFENAYLFPSALTPAINLKEVKLNGKVNDTIKNAIKGSGSFIKTDDYVTGFEFTMPIRPDAGETVTSGVHLDTGKLNKFEIVDLEVYGALSDKGDVVAKVDGRGVANEVVEAVIANVKAPVEVTISEVAELKVGLKDQKAGKVVIKETDKGEIDKQTIVLTAEDIQFSNKTEHKPVVKVTAGDLLIDSYSVTKDGGLEIKVKRSSTVASTIEVSDLVMTTYRSIPEGKYELSLTGSAFLGKNDERQFITKKDLVDEDRNYIVTEKFATINQPNVDDQADNGLKKGTSSFVIGSAKYVVNGVEAEMDGAPYIDNGRTMVPVRYVANALGVDGKNIYFAAGTASIVAGNKTVSLTVGNAVAKLNGVPARTMTAAPVVKDGRTYVPVAEIGALLGVEATWDSATQTATFVNK